MSRRRPDTPVDPGRVWFRFLRLHQQLSGNGGALLKAEIGLSIAQFDVLSALLERAGVTQQELAERLFVTKGNISGLVERLVDAGHIRRSAVPGDRRARALHLTEAGAELAERGIAVQHAWIQGTLGKLPPADVEALGRILLAWRDEAGAPPVPENGAGRALRRAPGNSTR